MKSLSEWVEYVRCGAQVEWEEPIDSVAVVAEEA